MLCGRMKVTTKRVMSMNVDGQPRSGRSKKRWMDWVKDGMRIKRSMEMMSDRIEWKKKTCCAAISGIRGR
jgi:hypothetical protein